MRIGQGYDIHRLAERRPLILGGHRIPSPKGCVAHSDGDVLIHALIDALLGAACLGDIGSHFPPSDIKWKDADSGVLLCTVMELLEREGWKPVNLDSTIILESPKLRPHIDEIRASLASLTGLALQEVSVKAKTKEKQDAAGRGEAIEAHAIALIKRI
ncbi:MAG: 2-C-methyl-D-erythritol 2,4-cyclodiphosphate synthase [Spirochaetales bacterium]|nr:2-C-methyl-D-erythritol 2,4-cyclodiphosphate synthase [Spirochaetales bacterium]